MRCLTAREVTERAVRTLGLDPQALAFEAVEVISTLLRRAAGFLAPCSPRTLSSAVCDATRGLVDDPSRFEQSVEETLSAMVAHGDLLELPEVGETEDAGSLGRMLYLAQPSFFLRASGTAVLLGMAPDGASALPDNMSCRVEYNGYVRYLIPEVAEDLGSTLRAMGLREMAVEDWLKCPPVETAAVLIARYEQRLATQNRAGEVPGLSLLDSERSVRYYRGRWIQATNQSGRFVARRPQAYGADRWCYVEVVHGAAERLLDLPCDDSRLRGCDEAWRLQAAIDAERGLPQAFRHRACVAGGFHTLEVFSPMPAWTQRRWDTMGKRAPTRAGGMFAYAFPEDEIAEEIAFITDELWLSPVADAE